MALRPRSLDPRMAEARLEALCARSEQCTYDLLKKLTAWGIPSSEAASIISRLEAQGYVDDSRYAEAFVRDKYRFSRWGAYKIKMHLAARRISSGDIANALDAIDPEEYYTLLVAAIRAKARTLPEEDLSTSEGRAKIMRFGLARGFESALVSKALREVLKSR